MWKMAAGQGETNANRTERRGRDSDNEREVRVVSKLGRGKKTRREGKSGCDLVRRLMATRDLDCRSAIMFLVTDERRVTMDPTLEYTLGLLHAARRDIVQTSYDRGTQALGQWETAGTGIPGT